MTRAARRMLVITVLGFAVLLVLWDVLRTDRGQNHLAVTVVLSAIPELFQRRKELWRVLLRRIHSSKDGCSCPDSTRLRWGSTSFLQTFHLTRSSSRLRPVATRAK